MLFHYLMEISYCKSNDIVVSLTSTFHGKQSKHGLGIFPKKICLGSLHLNKQFYLYYFYSAF